MAMLKYIMYQVSVDRHFRRDKNFKYNLKQLNVNVLFRYFVKIEGGIISLH